MASSQSSATSSWPASRSSLVWEDLRRALDDLADRRGRSLVVVDAGGGSGGFAVPVAQLGHQVIVVDPSPDALASLARRADEVGAADQITGQQGDLDTLGDAVGAQRVDVLLCHDVLEVADDPDKGLAAAGAVLQAGGLLSVLAANRSAAVLGRVLAGRLDAAERLLEGGPDIGTGSGSTGPGSGGTGSGSGGTSTADRWYRRFDIAELVALVEAAGMDVLSVHGDRIFSDLVPGVVLDSEPHARDILQRLEATVARSPAYQAMATRLHLLARKPEADRA